MEDDFKTRLISFAREKGYGYTRFEQYTGISSGSIAKIKDGMSTASVAKIARKFPDLDLRWLILGGEKSADAAVSLSKAAPQVRQSKSMDVDTCMNIIESQAKTIECLMSKLYDI